MAQGFREIAGERVVVTSGGGVVSLVGLPFLVIGLFLVSMALGFVPVTNPSGRHWSGLLGLTFIGAVFSVLGGGLALGRAWTVVDAIRREVRNEWGLLWWRVRRTAQPLESGAIVLLAFKPGDSDTAAGYPVSLRSPGGVGLPVGEWHGYADAWRCAAAIARLLQVSLEDATTDRPQQTPASLLDAPLRERARTRDRALLVAEPPASPRSTVADEGGRVRITIPNPPMSLIAAAFRLLPLLIPFAMFPPLRRALLAPATPGIAALPGFALPLFSVLALLFVAVPMLSTLVTWLRSRIGRTVVLVSRDELRLEERGLWLTTTTRVAADDVLDVNVGSRAATIAAARIAGQQRVRDRRPASTGALDLGPNGARLIAFISRLARGRGIVVKTRQGLLAFGRELDDEEIRYLHAVIWRALIG